MNSTMNSSTNWFTYEELQREQQRENEEIDTLLNQATNWSLLNIMEERAETGAMDLFDRIDREEEQQIQEIQAMILRVQDDEEDAEEENIGYGEDGSFIGDFETFLDELIQFGSIYKENIPPPTNIMEEEDNQFYINEI